MAVTGDGRRHMGCGGPNDCMGIRVVVGGLECPLVSGRGVYDVSKGVTPMVFERRSILVGEENDNIGQIASLLM